MLCLSLNTCDREFDCFIHSANGFNEQSQARGLSRSESPRNSRALSKAFRDTIVISLPSKRSSFNEGSGAIKSEVKDLKDGFKALFTIQLCLQNSLLPQEIVG